MPTIMEVGMKNYITDGNYGTFGDFLIAKRCEKEMPSMQICDKVGISPGYYCDIERNRRYPPDREALACMVQALCLNEEDTATFYDLAGKARSEAPPDLPEYINEYQVVRVALRLAKDRGCVDDWHKFIRDLESRQTAGG
jgi:transcriptional regulator with XRE-family HTH domain